jgi:hypothetical protein
VNRGKCLSRENSNATTSIVLFFFLSFIFFLFFFLFCVLEDIVSELFFVSFYTKIGEKISLLVAGAGKDGARHGGGSDVEAATVTAVTSPLSSEGDTRHSVNSLPPSSENQKGLSAAPQLHPCKNTLAERSNWMGREGGDSDKS